MKIWNIVMLGTRYIQEKHRRRRSRYPNDSAYGRPFTPSIRRNISGSSTCGSTTSKCKAPERQRLTGQPCNGRSLGARGAGVLRGNSPVIGRAGKDWRSPGNDLDGVRSNRVTRPHPTALAAAFFFDPFESFSVLVSVCPGSK